MEAIWSSVQSILGLGIDPKELTFLQISLRGFVVFTVSLVMLRLGDGRFCPETMRRKSVSQHDIEEDMRLDAQTEELSEIRVARLERSGDLSFIEATK